MSLSYNPMSSLTAAHPPSREELLASHHREEVRAQTSPLFLPSIRTWFFWLAIAFVSLFMTSNSQAQTQENNTMATSIDASSTLPKVELERRHQVSFEHIYLIQALLNRSYILGLHYHYVVSPHWSVGAAWGKFGTRASLDWDTKTFQVGLTNYSLEARYKFLPFNEQGWFVSLSAVSFQAHAEGSFRGNSSAAPTTIETRHQQTALVPSLGYFFTGNTNRQSLFSELSINYGPSPYGAMIKGSVAGNDSNRSPVAEMQFEQRPSSVNFTGSIGYYF